MKRNVLPMAACAVVMLFIAANAMAMCFEQAGKRYDLAPDLLRAIAKVESNLNPRAVNLSHQARTGTRDLGVMQINSGHLAQLTQYGIDEQRLLSDPCMNVHVGAWLLAEKFTRYGSDWEGVGAYNAACSQLKGDDCLAARRAYAWKVHSAMQANTKGAASPASRVGLPAAPSPKAPASKTVAAVRAAPVQGTAGPADAAPAMPQALRHLVLAPK